MGKDSVASWLKDLLPVMATIAVTVIGASFAFASAKRATDVELVRMSIDILRAPVADSTKPLRAWAVEVLEQHSPVSLPDSLKVAIRDGIRFPLNYRLDAVGNMVYPYPDSDSGYLWWAERGPLILRDSSLRTARRAPPLTPPPPE